MNNNNNNYTLRKDNKIHIKIIKNKWSIKQINRINKTKWI